MQGGGAGLGVQIGAARVRGEAELVFGQRVAIGTRGVLAVAQLLVVGGAPLARECPREGPEGAAGHRFFFLPPPPRPTGGGSPPPPPPRGGACWGGAGPASLAAYRPP